MQQQQINRLYHKIISKQATEEEKDLFYKYLSNHPAEKDLYDRLRTIWEIRIPEEELISADDKFDKIWEKGKGKQKRNFFSSLSNDAVSFTLRVAATLLITGLLTYLFVVRVMNYPLQQEIAKIEIIQIKNPAGQQQKVYLPDGTVVWLNAKSNLSYPSKFVSAERNVSLEGEGYFEVSSDSLHPFVVSTQHLSVTALGTSFNVRSNSDDRNIQVSLLEGKVLVAKDTSVKDLEPGWCYKYNTNTGKNRVAKFEESEVMAWKNGILIFTNDNLKSTISKLENWYGVEIKVKGKPDKPWVLNAQFDNKNIKAVMENLSFARNFTYTLSNKHIHIEFIN